MLIERQARTFEVAALANPSTKYQAARGMRNHVYRAGQTFRLVLQPSSVSAQTFLVSVKYLTFDLKLLLRRVRAARYSLRFEALVTL